MKNNILFTAFRLTLVFFALFCGIYTLMVLGISKVLPMGDSEKNGKSYIYRNIGQGFTSDKYFWSRPSAVDYSAAGSGGSNKGPSNPLYLAEVSARIDTFLVHNPGVDKRELPSDLFTASGSGLDPHISVQAATVQVKRISKERNIEEFVLLQLINEHTEEPLLGLFGTERINVLNLNIQLDKISKTANPSL